MKQTKSLDYVLLAIGIITLIAVLAFFSLHTVGAQDVTPTPSLTGNLPDDTTLPTTPSGLIALFTFFGGTVVVNVLTGVVKKFIPESVSANTIKEFIAVVAMVLYLAFAFSGHLDWFGKGADLISQIAPLVAAIIGALGGSSMLHQLSANIGVPISGYKRG